jgi:hypothetical protein
LESADLERLLQPALLRLSLRLVDRPLRADARREGERLADDDDPEPPRLGSLERPLDPAACGM